MEITGCPWPSSVRPATENDKGVRIKQAESGLKIDHSLELLAGADTHDHACLLHRDLKRQLGVEIQ